jgi:hypothetical protein
MSAAGGGKSHLLRVASIAWCADIPGIQIALFRRLSDDITKNHLTGVSGYPELLADWVKAGHVKINFSARTITFWNGSKIHLCHCQYESDVSKYQGAEFQVEMFDEGTHFSETIYRYLRGRLRMGALKLPEKYVGMFPRILIGSNPGSVGHAWVKASFVDMAPPMELVQMPKNEGGLIRQFIPAKLEDNPTLMESDPMYADRLEGLGRPELVKALRDGDWNIVAGGMFDDVFSTKHQVLAPFEIPRTWRIDRSFDWGSGKPFAVLWFAESDGSSVRLADGSERNFPRGSIFQISEWYGSNGKPNEGLRMMNAEIARGVKERDLAMKRIVHAGPGDNSINDVINGTSIADEMARAPNYIRWTPSDKNPGSRKHGWDILRKLLKNAIDRPLEEPGFYIFDTCRNTIRTLPVLPRHATKDGDLDSDAEDHIADAIRYRVSAKKRTMTVSGLAI